MRAAARATRNGVVGMIGGLGGFLLPIAFGALNDFTGIWSSCFMLLLADAAAAFLWMHVVVRGMTRQTAAGHRPLASTTK